MRQRLAQFMAGRYGNDKLNVFILAVGIILALLSSFIRGTAGRIMSVLVLALLVLGYFRIFSRNYAARSRENEKYLRTRTKVVSWLKLMKQRWIQRRDYKFFRCPSCRTILRVPRGHNRIRITCRKCGHSFTGKT